jgi:hypothetical protein
MISASKGHIDYLSCPLIRAKTANGLSTITLLVLAYYTLLVQRPRSRLAS